MGGKSIAHKAAMHKARGLMKKSRYSGSRLMVRPEHMLEENDDTIFTPPSRDEVVCQKCGFKARYKFVRCPECNEVQR